MEGKFRRKRSIVYSQVNRQQLQTSSKALRKKHKSPETKRDRKKRHNYLKNSKRGMCASGTDILLTKFDMESSLHNVRAIKYSEAKEEYEMKNPGGLLKTECLFDSKVSFRRNRTMSRDCLQKALQNMEFSIEGGSKPVKHNNLQVKGEKICMNRFYFEKTLGRGVQGVVFSAYDTQLKMKVAVKKLLQSRKEDIDQHKREIKVLKALKRENFTQGFPMLYDSHLGKANFIVTELLGDSLSAMMHRHRATKGMRMKHVLMIGLQVLHRIRDLHSLDYVHGDIKPLNLIFGNGRDKNILYLIDYGLTRKESEFHRGDVSPSLYHRKNLVLNGTPIFASINLHLGWEKTFKKDDVESLFYLLIYLSKGCLPWSDFLLTGEDNYEEILKAKMNLNIDETCRNLPRAFKRLFQYFSKLENATEIDYEFIESLLQDSAEECGVKLLDPEGHRFHWILESKRATEDKSYYHCESKYLLSVNSILENWDDSRNMEFKRVEELVANKRKNRNLSNIRGKAINHSRKAPKIAKPRMRLKHARGFASEKVSLGSKLKNQVRGKAINMVNSNDPDPDSLDQDSLIKSKGKPHPSMLQKAASKQKNKVYPNKSDSLAKQPKALKLMKCHSPISSALDDFEIKISAIEGVYSPKIDHLFADFQEEDLHEFPADTQRHMPRLFNPNKLDLKEL